jgi:hypothetical protein
MLLSAEDIVNKYRVSIDDCKVAEAPQKFVTFNYIGSINKHFGVVKQSVQPIKDKYQSYIDKAVKNYESSDQPIPPAASALNEHVPFVSNKRQFRSKKLHALQKQRYNDQD